MTFKLEQDVQYISKVKLGVVTFGDGAFHWKQAAKRFVKDAHKSKIFSDIEKYELQDLSNILTTEELAFCKSNRGLGFWLWKPATMLSFARRTESDDLLIYCDAGTILNINEKSIQRLNQYLHLAFSQGIFAFETNHLELNWTKRDLLERFPKEYWFNDQFLASPLIGKPKSIIELCTDWLEIAREQNHHFIDDSPSIASNPINFIEHRHDQSILSLLLKKRGVVGVSQNETLFGNWLKDGNEYPFWNMRHVGSTHPKNAQLTNWFLRKIDKAASYRKSFRVGKEQL